MIDPEETRDVIAKSLHTLRTKRRKRLVDKHHGNQPL
jgi:propionyl-CoA carboxylase beta chain